MVLESLHSDALVNIRNLTIEAPKSEANNPVFDLERDVPEHTWEKLIAHLTTKAVEQDWGGVMILGGWMKVISPERLDRSSNPVFNIIIERYEEALAQHNSENDPDDLSFYKTGDDDMEDIDIGASLMLGEPVLIASDPDYEILWETGLSSFEEEVREGSTLAYQDAFYYKILGEGVALNDNDLVDKTRKEIEESLISLREEREKVFDIVTNLAKLKFVALSRLRNYRPKPNIVTDAVNLMANLANKDSWEEILDFAQLAASMKILAAETVRRTENGLEVILPVPPISESFQQPTLPLPEARRF